MTSTNVCSSLPGQHVTNTIFTPTRRARVNAPRTNWVMPLAEMPTRTSLLDRRSRRTARPPSSKLSSTPSRDLKNASRPPAMIACTSWAGVLNVGGISAASRTPSRPLVPAPTKTSRPPLPNASVIRSAAMAMRSFSRCTALMMRRSSLSISSAISSVEAWSIAMERGLMASVGRDCHLERFGMRRHPTEGAADTTPRSGGCQPARPAVPRRALRRRVGPGANRSGSARGENGGPGAPGLSDRRGLDRAGARHRCEMPSRHWSGRGFRCRFRAASRFSSCTRRGGQVDGGAANG